MRSTDFKTGKPAPTRVFASREERMSKRPFLNQHLNPSPKLRQPSSRKSAATSGLHPAKTLKNGLISGPTNVAFSCAGAVAQRLCHSPNSQVSEASRQRQLEGLLVPLLFLSGKFQCLCSKAISHDLADFYQRQSFH